MNVLSCACKKVGSIICCYTSWPTGLEKISLSSLFQGTVSQADSITVHFYRRQNKQKDLFSHQKKVPRKSPTLHIVNAWYLSFYVKDLYRRKGKRVSSANVFQFWDSMAYSVKN